MADLKEGATAQVTMVVEPSATAAYFAREADEVYPEVLSTPMLIGEMERAAAALIRPHLKEGELSVGVRIEVTHAAPTPVGGKVVSHARFTGRDGALLWFEVNSSDEGGEVGAGRHARAVVTKNAIMERAAKRKRND